MFFLFIKKGLVTSQPVLFCPRVSKGTSSAQAQHKHRRSSSPAFAQMHTSTTAARYLVSDRQSAVAMGNNPRLFCASSINCQQGQRSQSA